MMTEVQFFKYLEEECNLRLTQEQMEAVATNDCPVALISTAGSGKTSVVTAKLAYLILVKGIDPKRILVTSFSNQSAADMENRFISRFGRSINERISFSTIHSFAFSVFRDYAANLNMKYLVIENSNSPVSKNQLLSSLYKKYEREAVTEDKLKELSGFVSYIKNLMIMYSDLDKYDDQFPLSSFKEIYKEYEEIKREYIEEGRGKVRLLDFDDMLSMCYHALKKNSSMLEKYRRRYDYIMVDEAQDTSLVQNAIIRLIAYPKYNLCVVGDYRQSIYGWRGAVVEELICFKDRYPNAKVLYMNRNFRSTKNIVDVSAEFIKIIENSTYQNNIYTENELGEPIDLVASEDEFTQVDYILKYIKSRASFSEIAVIYRNNMSAIPLIERFTREEIPFYIKDEVSSFFNHWVATDILKFFEFAGKPWNVELFSELYYKMKSYISKKDVEALYYDLSTFDKASKSVFDRLSENPSYENQKSKLRDFKYKFEMLAKMKPKKAISFIENDLSYREYLKEAAEKFKHSMETIDNMLSTLKIIATEVNSLSEFSVKMDKLRSEMLSSKENRGRNAVTLTTSHSSKGLEWDEVFFIDTHNIPSSESMKKKDKGDNTDYFEEARVFFVSITRARKLLHVMYPQKRNGQKVWPSVFYNTLSSIAKPSKKLGNSIVGENINVLTEASMGHEVKHKKWGKGEIIEVDGDIISVRFSEGAVKRLSMDVCRKSKLLEAVRWNRNENK